MASVNLNYAYDIFISYRHKDNKVDGWVSAFVSNLKKELEAAFKEDISIYFDQNPQDGILETHHVNDTVSAKIKCLVFIPILSQTYCDPKSFAWAQEFKTFIAFAKTDPFGLNMKLLNGNTASRVLPLRIHELEAADKNLVEAELGGVLRSIDFIYRSAGVVRTLQQNEEDPKANLNHTYYRDQMSKVVRGIKELITAMQAPVGVSGQTANKPLVEAVSGSSRKKLSIAAAVVIVMGMVGYALFYFTGMGNKFFQERDKSIAVLPFENMNKDSTQDYFSNGIAEDILNHLVKIADLKVKSRTSTLKYKGTTKTMSEIGEELNVSNVLEGSVRRVGDKVRIVVQLIDTKTDTHLWSETYDRDFKDVLSLQSEIAIEIARALQAKLTSTERENISKQASHDITAYDYFLKAREIVNRFGWGISGNKSDLNNATRLVNQAILLDKNFAQAFSLKGMIWYLKRRSGVSQRTWVDSALYYSSKAIELDPTSPEGYLIRANSLRHIGKLDDAAIAILKAYEVSLNDPETQHSFGWQLINRDRNEKGADLILNSIKSQYQLQDPLYYLELARYHRVAGDLKGAEQLLLKARNLDPGSNDVIYMLYSLYELTKEYNKALNILQEGNQDSPAIIDAIAETYTLKKDYSSAIKYYERYKEIESGFEDTTQSVPLRHRLAYAYSEMGRKKEADILIHEQLKILEDVIAGKRGVWSGLDAAYYDHALCLAYLGKKDEAVASLDSAFYFGWRSDFYYHNDPLLANLQDHRGFQAFLKKVDTFTDFRREAFTNALNRAQASKELKGVMEK